MEEQEKIKQRIPEKILDNYRALDDLNPDQPPPFERLPGIRYKPLQTAGENIWKYYIKLTRAASEQHAKVYLLTQGWDVDEQFSYFREMKERIDAGQSLKTKHLFHYKNVRPGDHTQEDLTL